MRGHFLNKLCDRCKPLSFVYVGIFRKKITKGIIWSTASTYVIITGIKLVGFVYIPMYNIKVCNKDFVVQSEKFLEKFK